MQQVFGSYVLIEKEGPLYSTSLGFTLGVLFKLKAGLHRLHCSGMVFATKNKQL